MFCTRCGNSIDNTCTFCPNCGEQLQQKQSAPKKKNWILSSVIVFFVCSIMTIGVVFASNFISKKTHTNDSIVADSDYIRDDIITESITIEPATELAQPTSQRFYVSMCQEKTRYYNSDISGENGQYRYITSTTYYADPTQIKKKISEDSAVIYNYNEDLILQSIVFQNIESGAIEQEYTFSYVDVNGTIKGISNTYSFDAYNIDEINTEVETRFEIQYAGNRMLSLKCFCNEEVLSGDEYEYFGNGRIKKHIEISGSIGLDRKVTKLSKNITSYNEDGTLAETELYGNDDYLIHRISYSYKNGKETEIAEEYGENEHQESSTLLLTKSKDGVDTFTKYGDNNIIGYRYDYYDENHLVAKVELTDQSENVQEYTLFSYDTNGNMIEKQTFDKNGDLQGYILFSYDNNGNMIEQQTFDINGDLAYEVKQSFVLF